MSMNLLDQVPVGEIRRLMNAIMKQHKSYRRALARELRRRYAALVTELSMTTLRSTRTPTDNALAVAIDDYCRDVAGTRDLAWQHCTAAVVWFIGTTGRHI